MEGYLYYRRGDEWVRVEATRYTQQAASDPSYLAGQNSGLCAVSYLVTHSHTAISAWTGRDAGYKNQVIELFGPIGSISAQYGPNNSGLTVTIIANGMPFNVVSRGGAWMGTPSAVINSVRRSDGQVDNCGQRQGNCETKFYNDELLVFTLSSCPEITNGQGCQDCCRELLPAMRSLTI